MCEIFMSAGSNVFGTEWFPEAPVEAGELGLGAE